MLLRIMVRETDICKIILLGDVNQLPSIEPGNVLRDFFRALQPAGFAIELKTNHRSEGTIIFNNAEKISKGLPPILDS